MILVDTRPFVALFDPQDAEHGRCKEVLRSLREALFTTTPVLTEAFHLLRPNSIGADRLRDFILEGGVAVWFLDQAAVTRAFELMEQYKDHPMDLADASIHCGRGVAAHHESVHTGPNRLPGISSPARPPPRQSGYPGIEGWDSCMAQPPRQKRNRAFS